MPITINDQAPEYYGITAGGISLREAALNASVLTLPVVAEEYDADTALAHGAAVVVKVDSTTVFQGKVTRTPRAMSAGSEGWTYEARDPWDKLERLVYQVPRNYKTDEDGDYASWTGAVTWTEADTLGERIEAVAQYAIDNGANIAIGTITAGIPWYRASYKDMACAELMREMMRLMPDYVLSLDIRQSTPTLNLTKREDMTAVSYDVTAGNVIVTNEIEALESEVSSEVVLRYEKPVEIDGVTSEEPQIIEDVAPEGADGRSDNALVESIPIDGFSAQYEYAPVTVAPIPQAGASSADIVSWYIDHTPALDALSAKYGKTAVAAKIVAATSNVPAENVVAHTIEVIDDGITRPAPVNPESTPVVQTTDPADYPNEIIEGSLPEWAKRRFRPIAASCTLAISGATDAADGQLEQALLEIFTLEKNFGGNDYFCAQCSGQVNATNAVTKNYTRTVSYDPGETPPTGVAAALLAQLSQTRHTGSLEITGMEIDLAPRVSKVLNLTNGRTEWATMKESIQSIQHNLNSGTSTLTFGPPEQLGANDFIERLRAQRRNTYSPGTASTPTDGVGGITGTAQSNFNITGSEASAGSPHPWKVEVSGTTATISTEAENILFSSVSATDTTTVTGVDSDQTVATDKLVCIKWDLSAETASISIEDSVGFEPVEHNGSDEPIATYKPLAKILNTSTVEQYVYTQLHLETRIVAGDLVTLIMAN